MFAVNGLLTRFSKRAKNSVATVCLLGDITVLSGCFGKEFAKHEIPLPAELVTQMAAIGVDQTSPIFIRIFKREAELEVWKRTSNGEQTLLKTYEICAWSGDLGPKFQEGDRQAPEGFYKVTPALMNPNSSFHLSFNLGFPNAYDRSHERTGSFLMVHGACSSAGCYSMEDAQIEEIYALAREAFKGGQKEFQVHAFPFRMTAENMAIFRNDEHTPFWRMLKRGYEHFEVTRKEPKVDSCDGKYVFNANAVEEEAKFNAELPCPEYTQPELTKQLVDQKIAIDEVKESQIAQQWAENPKHHKYVELTERLKTERERIQRFTDRGLGFNSHQKRRIQALETQLANLGYTPPAPITSSAESSS